MIKTMLFDFSRTLLFPKDKNYTGGLNDLYKKVSLIPNFNFFDYFELNNNLIDYLGAIKNKFNFCIFTSESIQNDPAILSKLKSIFNRIYSAKEIGYSKKDIGSYKFIVSDLNVDSSEILFVDDSIENIEVAKQIGIQTIIYDGFDKFVEKLKELGIKN